MKTKSVIAMTLIALFSCFFISCKKNKGPVIELSYSVFFPPTHVQCKAAVSWAQEIEKRTNGAVKINVFPGGTLTSANECYSGVVKGISDIGMSCFSYTKGRFPEMEAVDLPLGYRSGKMATYAAWEYYKTMKPTELDDVKVLYIHAHGPGLLHGKKEIKKLEDIKGMKIRSTGLSSNIVTVLGGTPVAMPQGETYEALQKGVVDATFAPIETLKGWRQAEVVKSTTNCYSIGYTTSMFIVMNKAKWDALPEDIKKVFTEVNEEWIKVHAAEWDTADVEGKKFSQERGNSYIELDETEHSRWRAAVKPVISAYVDEKKKAGLQVQKGIDFLQNYIKNFKE
jgi:TRAP-type C4-dicarboxylate transport system substrate-binding protein